MTKISFKIDKKNKKPEKVVVSFDAKKFERVAADFGMFRKEFLESIERAEKDIKAGRVRKVKSLASLRK